MKRAVRKRKRSKPVVTPFKPYRLPIITDASNDGCLYNDIEADDPSVPLRSYHYSSVIADMHAKRSAPKATTPYTIDGTEQQKLRNCLTECFNVLAEAIIQAAKIMRPVKKRPKTKPRRRK